MNFSSYLEKIRSAAKICFGFLNSKAYFLLLIFLFSYLLAFYIIPLGKYSFSPDEVFISRIAEKGPSEIINFHKDNIDPPLERLIDFPFTIIGTYFYNKGENLEFFYRLPYLIFSILTLYLIYIFTKLITKNKKYALLSAIFCLTLFYFFRYSQEMRYYSMYAFFFLLSNFYFYKITFGKELDKKNFIKLLIINILSFYLNIFTLFNVLIQSIYFVYFNWKKSAILSYIKYAIFFTAFILPWFFYNEKLKIAVSAVFYFGHPQQSILGGTDWLLPPAEIQFFSLAIDTIQHLFVDKLSFIILLSIFIVVLIYTWKEKMGKILYWIIFVIIGNYLLCFFSTIFLIPGVLSDYGSTERRLVFLLPLLSILLVTGIYYMKNKKMRLALLGIMFIFSLIQIRHSYDWLFTEHPQSKFLYGVDSKKEFQGVNEIVPYLKHSENDGIILIDAYSTGDAVLDYYLSKNKIKHKLPSPKKITPENNNVSLFSYQNIKVNEIPMNNKLILEKQFGNYELYTWAINN